MYILRLPLPHLGILYHAVYDNKSGIISNLKIFGNDSNQKLEELYIEKDYSIEYYMDIYYQMSKYINSVLINSSST